MKKLLSIVLVISTLFSICFLFASCGKEPTFEENIVGTWESQKDGSKNKVTLVFEYKDENLKGTQSYYDYDNSEWGELTFKVGDRTDYTITLLYDGGKIDTVSYSLGKDTLIFDSMVYKNESKNIEIDLEQKTYILDGVPMPVRAGMYFGMTKSEVKSFADTKYCHTSDDGDTLFYELPDFFYPQVDGYASYSFDENGKFSGHSFSFYEDKDADKMSKLKKNLIDAYSSQYGKYSTFEWTTSEGTVSYAWQSGNMSVVIRVWGDGGITVIYTLEYREY